MELLAKHGHEAHVLDFWGFGEFAKQGAYPVGKCVDTSAQSVARAELWQTYAVVSSLVQGSVLAFPPKVSGRPWFAGLPRMSPGLVNSSINLLCLTDSG